MLSFWPQWWQVVSGHRDCYDSNKYGSKLLDTGCKWAWWILWKPYKGNHRLTESWCGILITFSMSSITMLMVSCPFGNMLRGGSSNYYLHALQKYFYQYSGNSCLHKYWCTVDTLYHQFPKWPSTKSSQTITAQTLLQSTDFRVNASPFLRQQLFALDNYVLLLQTCDVSRLYMMR